jgi:hypothetical protein
MHRRLRQVVRTPHLRVLAWLAWLMLAASPVFAAPFGTGAHDMGPPASTMQMVGHAAHDLSAMAADCCAAPDAHGHGAVNDCPCPATCVSALPASAMGTLASVPAVAMPVTRRGAMAPDFFRSPPLRPPLLQTLR